jgi:hypothetical protein
MNNEKRHILALTSYEEVLLLLLACMLLPDDESVL